VAIYGGILVEADFDPAESALFPLALLAVPFTVAHLVLRRWPAAGRVVSAVFAAGLVAFCTYLIILNGLGDWWASVVTLVVGGLTCLARASWSRCCLATARPRGAAPPV
jgi:hypothetical protein